MNVKFQPHQSFLIRFFRCHPSRLILPPSQPDHPLLSGGGRNCRYLSSIASSSSSSSCTRTTSITKQPQPPPPPPPQYTFRRLGLGLGQWNAIMNTDMEDNNNSDPVTNTTTTTTTSTDTPVVSVTSPYEQMQQIMYQRIITEMIFSHEHKNHSQHNTIIDPSSDGSGGGGGGGGGGLSNTIEIGFQSRHDISFVQAYRTIVQERLSPAPPLGEIDSTSTATITTNTADNSTTFSSTTTTTTTTTTTMHGRSSSSSSSIPLINVLWRIGYREIPAVILPSPKDRGEIPSSSSSSSSSSTSSSSPSSPPSSSSSSHHPIDTYAPDTSLSFLTNDPVYQQQQHQQRQQRQKLLAFPKHHSQDVIVPPDVTTASTTLSTPSSGLVQPGQLIHNISSDYIQYLLLGKPINNPYANVNANNSGINNNINNNNGSPDIHVPVDYESLAPLLQLKQDYPDSIRLIIVIHNPETQYERFYRGQQNLHPVVLQHYRSVSEYLDAILYPAFTTLQAICTNTTTTTTTNNTVNNHSTSKSITSPLIDGYGIVANGLSLPETHPLHVSYRTIAYTAHRVYQGSVVAATSSSSSSSATEPDQNHDNDKGTTQSSSNNNNDPNSASFSPPPPPPNFCAIQLPANALESNGITVATKIQQLKQDDIIRCRNNNEISYLTNLHVIGMRPLKCFSDGGTGSNTTHPSTRKYRNDDNQALLSSLMMQSSQFPFTLVDYAVTQKVNREMVTTNTNEMVQPPVAYNAAYQRAVQLFDGHEILERQAERRYAAKKANEKKMDKTPMSVLLDTIIEDPQGGGSFGNDYLNDEERETLHGCNILYQMIQNCHEVLKNARCIQIHEMLLSQYVLPILSDQFASLDDQTSRTLEAYFTAYGPTMQYYVALNTRQLLLHGETTTTTQNVDSTNKNDTDDQNHMTTTGSSTSSDTAVSLSSSPPPRYDYVPRTKRLQEFGLELLLQQQIKVQPHHNPTSYLDTATTATTTTTVSTGSTTPMMDTSAHRTTNDDSVVMVNVFDTVMVGIATVDEAVDTMKIVHTYQNTK